MKLVHDPAGVQEIRPTGPVMQGKTWEADIILYATGFDSMDGNMNGILVKGRNGRTLEDRWADRAEAMYGIHVDGFPNMFMALGVTGLSFSMQAIACCEENTAWAANLITHMREKGLKVCDAKPEEVEAHRIRNQTHGERTVWSRCSTYYNDPKGNLLIMVRPWDVVLAEKAKIAEAGYTTHFNLE